MFFTVIFITGCRAPEPKLISEDNIILTKDGLNDYYSKIFTEFRNAKGKDRKKYEDIFLYFFSQFRIVDLQKDYHKNPCLITKKAVIALMGEPDSINEFNPNRYRYITLKDNGRTYYITIIFKDNLFDDITFGSFIK
jgi:hypothetical protein